ncbi:uncharacterized protein PHALS_02947 [Plasmopara halstedii]|uniref:Uncharacterized protein n=1 Tax=Plasmopara halstedii TaxID=4781 RepID=A0A0P1B009_PLAHL|nr:uncharacterized protein PHALS_02947 [Plasmopara halstedii]CEG46548.1 hypothetical protein PHALS_02947 [Plasmopara halstedii]|eukprot:XP_024582917.1 hypothetical protein PHALS_02947 [Plasmopara halstedii]
MAVVDYESDTPFPAWNDEGGELRQRRDTSPARALRTPCPFPDFSSTERYGVISNDLDEAQKRQLEAAPKADLMRAHPRSHIDPLVEYDFRPANPAVETNDAVTRSLRVHIIGPVARTDDELATRRALRARFLVPQESPLDVYRTRLRTQRGARVPAMRTIPVVLAPGESATDDEALFERWVKRHRKLISLHNLQLSHKEVDVREERHLSFCQAQGTPSTSFGLSPCEVWVNNP